MSIWAILSIILVLAYLYAGYIIIKAGVTSLNKEQEFEWTLQNIGYMIGWLPLIAFSYIVLALNYDKMQPGGDPTKKPEPVVEEVVEEVVEVLEEVAPIVEDKPVVEKKK